MNYDFKGKTAVVTGAASGMGLCFCKAFAAAGGNAVLADIHPEGLSAAVDAIRETGGSAIGVPCDVRSYTDVCRVRDEAVAAFGTIDVLVNFAGGAELRMCHAEGKDFPDVPIEVYDWGIDVNLKGQLYFAHAVAKTMREQNGGVIVNIGSITGAEGCGGNVAYSTAKSGVMEGMTRSLAQFGAPYGIRCVCVAPGPVLTRPDMAGMKTLARRAAEPEEIVDAVLFLASDRGAFVNGTTLLIDGGRFAMQRG